jgi:hypothetical protein
MRAARCAVLLLLATGCAAPVPRMVDFSETRRGYGPNDYDRVRKSWTRHAKVVEDVGTVIEMWGLYKSWEFREAYIERYAKVYSLNEAERKSLYAAQLEASRQTYEFHVPAQTTNYKWNDLEKATSAWKVSLLDGSGAELAPRRIEVPRLPELYEATFFPDRTEFSRTYVIRFDRAEAEAAGFGGQGTGRIVLRVASPMARVELIWQSR